VSRLAPTYVRINTASAETTAETWAETGKAQAILVRMDRLDDLMDAIAGHDLGNVTDAIGEEWSNAECELDNIRTAVLDEAWAEHPSDDDEVQWELDKHAPSVADAIKGPMQGLEICPARFVETTVRPNRDGGYHLEAA
jgi:hypothetical protein